MTKTIFSIFPKHVYVRDNVCLAHLDKFKDKILEIADAKNTVTRNRFLNVDSTHYVTQQLHQDEVFLPLVAEIKNSVLEFGETLGYGIDRCFLMEIDSMWANISDENDYNWPHIHQGSILSGAFYIENQIESNSLTFFDNYSSIEYPINNTLGENFDRQSFSCRKGRLIMFKSDLPHGNTPQVGQGKKITISFNMR